MYDTPSPQTLARDGKTTWTSPSDAAPLRAMPCAASRDCSNTTAMAIYATRFIDASVSGRENLSEELHRCRILRLSEPEHGLLAHVDIAIGACDLHQLPHRAIVVALRQD